MKDDKKKMEDDQFKSKLKTTQKIQNERRPNWKTKKKMTKKIRMEK